MLGSQLDPTLTDFFEECFFVFSFNRHTTTR